MGSGKFSNLLSESSRRHSSSQCFSGLASRFLDRRRFVDYGFHFDGRWWKLFAAGVAMGLLFQAVPNAIGLLTGQLRLVKIFNQPDQSIPVWLGLVVAVPHMLLIGYWEEASLRGHPVRNLSETFEGLRPGLRPWAGILTLGFSGVVFGIAHLYNGIQEAHRLVFLIAWGMSLAAVYTVHGELAFPIGYHAAADFGVLHLFTDSKHVESVFLIEAVRSTTSLSTLSFLAFVIPVFLWLAFVTGKPGYRSPLAEYRPLPEDSKAGLGG